MAKGGAAKGAKRARFEEHRVSKKLRQHKKLVNIGSNSAGWLEHELGARAPTKAKRQKEEPCWCFADVAPFLRTSPLCALRALAKRNCAASAVDVTETPDDDDNSAAARKARAQLLSSIKRASTGRAQLDMPTWLREFVERQWTPEDDAMLAITWSWRTAGGERLDFLNREVMMPGEAEPVAIAGVEPVPWPGADDCAGASALQLTLEDKRRVTMMLQRSFRGDLRLVGDGIIATRDAEQEDDED